MASQQPRKGINSPKVIIPEGVSEFYANSLQVMSTDWDFALLFGSIIFPANYPLGNQRVQGTEVRVDAIIRMSPQQAKASLRVLNRVIEDYEAKYGKINIPQEVINADTAGK